MRDLAATTECIDGEAAGVKVDRFASPSITLALRWRRSARRSALAANRPPKLTRQSRPGPAALPTRLQA